MSAFESLSLRRPIHIINPVDKTKLSSISKQIRFPHSALPQAKWIGDLIK